MADKSLIEYKRQLPEQLNEGQLAFLQARTPKAFIKFRQGRGGDFPYVEVGYVQLMLNTIFGNAGWDWEYEIVAPLSFPNTQQIVVNGKLTARVHNKDTGEIIATIVKTASGGGEIKLWKGTDKPIDLADDLKSASADALKKAASYIGIAADIYAPKVYALVEAGRKKKGTTSPAVEIIDEETNKEIEAIEEEPQASTKDIRNQLLRSIFAAANKIHSVKLDARWLRLTDEERKMEIKEALKKQGLNINSFAEAPIEDLKRAAEMLNANENQSPPFMAWQSGHKG